MAWLYGHETAFRRVIPNFDILTDMFSGQELDDQVAKSQLGTRRRGSQDPAQCSNTKRTNNSIRVQWQTTFPTDAKSFFTTMFPSLMRHVGPSAMAIMMGSSRRISI